MQSNVFLVMPKAQYQIASFIQLAGTYGSAITIPAFKVKHPIAKIACPVQSDFIEELLETQDLLIAWKSGRTITLAATTSLSPSFKETVQLGQTLIEGRRCPPVGAFNPPPLFCPQKWAVACWTPLHNSAPPIPPIASAHSAGPLQKVRPLVFVSSLFCRIISELEK